MPVAKKQTFLINKPSEEVGKTGRPLGCLLWAIPCPQPTIHRLTAYHRFSSGLLARTIAAYTEHPREDYGKGALTRSVEQEKNRENGGVKTDRPSANYNGYKKSVKEITD